MKRVLGWLANFYPRHHFYSNDFCGDLDWSLTEGDFDTPHQSSAMTAMLAVSIAAGRNLKEGGKMTAEFTGVTDAGKDVGDFRIIVERLPTPPDTGGAE